MIKDDLDTRDLENVCIQYKKLAVEANCEMIKHLSQDECNDNYLDELYDHLKYYLDIHKTYNQIIEQRKALKKLINEGCKQNV